MSLVPTIFYSHYPVDEKLDEKAALVLLPTWESFLEGDKYDVVNTERLITAFGNMLGLPFPFTILDVMNSPFSLDDKGQYNPIAVELMKLLAAQDIASAYASSLTNEFMTYNEMIETMAGEVEDVSTILRGISDPLTQILSGGERWINKRAALRNLYNNFSDMISLARDMNSKSLPSLTYGPMRAEGKWKIYVDSKDTGATDLNAFLSVISGIDGEILMVNDDGRGYLFLAEEFPKDRDQISADPDAAAAEAQLSRAQLRKAQAALP